MSMEIREVDGLMIGSALASPFNVATDGNKDHSALELLIGLVNHPGVLDLGWSPLSVSRLPSEKSNEDASLPLEGVDVGVKRKELIGVDRDILTFGSMSIRISYPAIHVELIDVHHKEQLINELGGVTELETTETRRISVSFTGNYLPVSYAMARQVGRFFNRFTGWTKREDGVWVPPTAQPTA